MKKLKKYLIGFMILAGIAMGIGGTENLLTGYAAETQPEEMKASIKLQKNSDNTKISVTVGNVRELNIQEKIIVYVWSSKNGKDDEKAYTLYYEDDGTYQRTVSIKNHKNSTGKYYVQACLVNETGTEENLGRKTINIAGISGGKISFKNVDNTAGTCTVRIENLTSPVNIKKVRVCAWNTKDGNDDAKWYTAKKKGNYWYLDFNTSKHDYISGKYKFKVKVWDDRGVIVTLPEKSKTIKVNHNITTKIVGDTTQSQYTVTVNNVRYAEKVKKVQVAVWSKNSGTDDKKWYTAKESENGTYETTVDISDHKDTGTYYAYTYITLEGSARKLINKKTFTVKGISASNVYFTYKNDEKGSVEVNISGVTSPAEIKKVEIRTYSSKNGKDDLVKSEAQKIGNLYKKNISVVDHNYYSGKYKIDVYITDARGIVKKLSTRTIELKCLDSYKEKTSFAGIDVSKFQGNIDWNRVKAAGIDFVFIRVGYRGYQYGTIVEDPYFETNIKGALAAGIDVGVYFFSQAVTEAEAREEAAWTAAKIAPYKITYPVVIDTEYVSGGRANALSASARTAVVNAFCQQVKLEGYTPMIYASKSWLENNLIMGYLSGYEVWLARYAAAPEYTGSFQVWQYTSKGYVDGISGYVDRNIGYKRYY